MKGSMEDYQKQIEELKSTVLEHSQRIHELETLLITQQRHQEVKEVPEAELFEKVVQFLKDKKTCTSSGLQRQFSIGYAQAVRMMDELETAGLIGSGYGATPREVNKDKLNTYLNNQMK